MNFGCLKPDEIRTRYRQAEDKREIIRILAELTCSSAKEMREFLDDPNPKSLRKPSSRLDETTARKLYDSGLNDAEIAPRLGVSVTAVCQWRQRERLPSHIPTTKSTQAERMALWRQGLNDSEIAVKLHMHPATVFSWRKRCGLPPNAGPGGRRNQKTEEENK